MQNKFSPAFYFVIIIWRCNFFDEGAAAPFYSGLNGCFSKKQTPSFTAKGRPGFEFSKNLFIFRRFSTI
jgi:hypothetical protein